MLVSGLETHTSNNNSLEYENVHACDQGTKGGLQKTTNSPGEAWMTIAAPGITIRYEPCVIRKSSNVQ
jgi:hypothetical protein